MVATRDGPSSTRAKTQMSCVATTASLDDDGDHRRDVTGSEKSDGSLTGLAERSVCVERMLMVVDGEAVAVATH